MSKMDKVIDSIKTVYEVVEKLRKEHPSFKPLSFAKGMK